MTKSFVLGTSLDLQTLKLTKIVLKILYMLSFGVTILFSRLAGINGHSFFFIKNKLNKNIEAEIARNIRTI